MSSIKTRVRALQILNKAEAPGAHSSALLQRASTERDLNYGLLQRLVKGTLQWKARIDDELDRLLGTQAEIPQNLRNVLRMAAYQILFLEKVEVPLVTKETLELAKPHARILDADSLVRLLRSLQGALKRPAAAADGSAKQISLAYSHPLWIVERWIDQLGAEETVALCRANNRPWPTCVRTNTSKISPYQLEKKLHAEWVKVEQCKYATECFRILELPRNTRLHELESFRRGLFQVQDESSALVGRLVDPHPGEFIIDMCAAPGGKATHMATLMKNRGKILALDSNAKKLEYVRENSRKLGLRIIQTRRADAAKFRTRELADRILIDAPCSGLGVIGRKADLRWAKSANEISQLAELQSAIISNAASLVRPAGVLVYSTCTVEPAENEDVIKAFLDQHEDFKLLPPPGDFDPKLFTCQGYLRTWPHRHRMAGGFAAALRRAG